MMIFLAISACSPHPGSGTWISDGNNPLKVAKIVTTFEGTADFYSIVTEAAPQTNEDEDEDEDKKKGVIRRCFWSASSDSQIEFQCVHTDNTDIKESYSFTVIEKNQAQLTQNEQLIALFKKQIP